MNLTQVLILLVIVVSLRRWGAGGGGRGSVFLVNIKASYVIRLGWFSVGLGELHHTLQAKPHP